MDDRDLHDPAEAFDLLRQEVSLCVRALQGLTAERQHMPDYSATLKSIDQGLRAAADNIGEMAKMPALRMTPATFAAEMELAATAARAGDRQLLDGANRGNADLTHELRLAIQQVEVAKTQRRHLLCSAAAGFCGGIALMIAGWWMFG